MFNKHYRVLKLETLFVVLSLMLFILFFTPNRVFPQNVFPGKTWEKVENPEGLGFSVEKLEEAKKFADQGKTAAVVIVVNGKILYEWGEVQRDFITHSSRKSFLSDPAFWQDYSLLQKIPTDIYGSDGMLIFERRTS